MPRASGSTAPVLQDEAVALCEAAASLARCFRHGGRLLVSGAPGFEADADHVCVEFLHPVVTGARALPALRVPTHSAASATTWLDACARSGDVWLGIGTSLDDMVLGSCAANASRSGLRTLAIVEDPAGADLVDQCIAIGDTPAGSKEEHVAAYHILWELVHVLLAHDGTAP